MSIIPLLGRVVLELSSLRFKEKDVGAENKTEINIKIIFMDNPQNS